MWSILGVDIIHFGGGGGVKSGAKEANGLRRSQKKILITVAYRFYIFIGRGFRGYNGLENLIKCRLELEIA
jgi:hypothetical protein